MITAIMKPQMGQAEDEGEDEDGCISRFSLPVCLLLHHLQHSTSCCSPAYRAHLHEDLCPPPAYATALKTASCCCSPACQTNLHQVLAAKNFAPHD